MDTFTDHPPGLDRQITKLWPRDMREELIRAADDVHAITGLPGYQAILSVVNAEIAAIDNTLDSGHKALDHADYALLHGRRSGLRGLEGAIRAILNRARAAQHELDHENAAETATV